MRYLLIVLCLGTLGLVGCIPPKVPVYPVIQHNTTQINPYMANMTQVPVYVPPVTQEAPNNQPVPSNPNPYLNQTVYPPLDSYFVPPPNYHYTPWIGGWYNYQVPIIQQGVVFWTGSVTVIVQ